VLPLPARDAREFRLIGAADFLTVLKWLWNPRRTEAYNVKSSPTILRAELRVGRPPWSEGLSDDSAGMLEAESIRRET